MPPLTNDDVNSYRRIVEELKAPSREADAIIFQHLLYPDWFRSKTLSNMLVDNERLIATKFISGHTKIIPSLTKSFDAVFETFSETILNASRFILKKEKTGGLWACTLTLDEDGARLNNKRHGFNPACATLSAVIMTYYKRIEL